MKKLVNLIMMVFVVSAMSAKNNPETTNSGISIDKVYLSKRAHSHTTFMRTIENLFF